MAETTIVPMPPMGVSVTEGTVTAWLKAPGETVAEGEVICEIVTDKVDTEIEAPVAGVLARIVAEVGESVAVGEPIAEIAPAGAEAPPISAAKPPTPEVETVQPGAPPEPAPTETPTTEAPRVAATLGAAGTPAVAEPRRFDPEAAAEAVVRVVAGNGVVASSPVARRFAADRGIDLQTVRGTGRRGRIRKADVLAALEHRERSTAATPAAASLPATAPAGELPRGYENVPYEVVPTSPQRRAIAEHMVRSRHTAAHMTTEVEVDMHRVSRVRVELNERQLAAGQPKLSFLPFVARAACAALREFPDLNATFEPERLIRWQNVNLGIAVDTGRGLLVPVIRGCDRLNVFGVAEAAADLAARARSRSLSPDDMIGGTFTVSNPGSVGAVSAPAIINQPQVAILGMPTIVKRPWVVPGPDGEEVIVPRPIMRLALTFDHRAVDGAYATRCAVLIKNALESWDAPAYT